MPLYVGTHSTDCVKVYRGIYPFCKIYQGSTLKWWASDCQACVKYGYLYNWYAATDARNIANTGWHVPSKTEFETLVSELGGDTVAGGYLKETGLTHWNSPNTGADNSSGFYGRGSGLRYAFNVFPYDFFLIKVALACWLQDLYSPINPYGFVLYYNSSGLGIGPVYSDPSSDGRLIGISIRFIKDDSTLATYVGNDGKSYQTVKIGDQVWMAENLAETEYRDHSKISIVEDATVWSGLTAGAMCAYNNDYSLVGCGETEPEQCFQFIVNATTSSYKLNYFRLKGTNGKIINIDWGDGNTDSLTFNGAIQSTFDNYTYTNAGNYLVTISGDIDEWTYLEWSTWNCIANIETFPAGLKEVQFQFMGSNLIGDIDNIISLPTKLRLNYCAGLTGNISNLPSSIIDLAINYSGTAYTGDVKDLSSSMTNLALSYLGDNVYIALSDLPTSLTTLAIAGTDNHGSGDLTELPTGLTYIDFFGFGSQLTGEISDLQGYSLTYCRLWLNANSLITGNIQDMCTTVKFSILANMTLVSGDINTLCSTISGIYMIQLQGLNNITGEVGNLPNTIQTLLVQTCGDLLTYNVTYPYWANMYNITIKNGFDQTKVDAILADIVACGSTNHYLDLRGNATPSATGLADKATLVSRGWTVYTA